MRTIFCENVEISQQKNAKFNPLKFNPIKSPGSASPSSKKGHKTIVKRISFKLSHFYKELLCWGSTLQLISFFVLKKAINCKFVDVSPSLVDMTSSYFDLFSTDIRYVKVLFVLVLNLNPFFLISKNKFQWNARKNPSSTVITHPYL